VTPTDLVIATDGLSKLYSRGVGCEEMHLRVRRGCIFGFLGPNGAGKSTFIKMMVGLHRPTSGTGEMLGKPLGDVRTRARIGFLPENFRFQEWLTPRELLAFHGQLLGMTRSAVADASQRVLAEVGMAENADVKLRDFSKGMQQRFGMACALLSDPELLFLDEPTSALDPIGRAEVRQLLLRARDRGTTVFLNSHLLSEVEQVCDEVAVIDRGHLVTSGTLAELLDGPCEVEIALAAPSPLGAAAAVAKAVQGRVLEESPDRLVISLPGDDAIPAAVDRLVAEGARVRGVAPRKRTLESLFMEVTADGRSE
jgi:ABC-2 type transport system ATP-binding protein